MNTQFLIQALGGEADDKNWMGAPLSKFMAEGAPGAGLTLSGDPDADAKIKQLQGFAAQAQRTEPTAS